MGEELARVGSRAARAAPARSWSGAPAPRRGAPAGGQVDLEVVDADHRGCRRRVRDPAQDRADAREQLLDVERLGDVVVGAGVERARSCPAWRSRAVNTTTGTSLNERMRRSASMPSRSGSPRSRSTDVGSPVGDEHQTPPRRSRVSITSSDTRPQARAQRAAQGAVVLDHEHRRHGRLSCPARVGTTKTNVAPPPGVSSHHTLPPCAVDEGVHDGEAETGAGGVGPGVDPGELLEDPRTLGFGHAGSVVGDAHLDAVAGRRSRSPRPGSRNRAARSAARSRAGCRRPVPSSRCRRRDRARSRRTSRRTRWARASGRSRRTATCARSRDVDRLAPHFERRRPGCGSARGCW